MNKGLFLMLLLTWSGSAIGQKKWFRVDDPESKTCYFVDTLGHIAPIGVHDKMYIADQFSEGLICVNFKKNNRDKDAWGCLTENGDTAIRGKYLEAFDFYNGVAKVYTALMPNHITGDDAELNYYCHYINLQGGLICDKFFEGNESSIMNHTWAIVKSKKQWYILSKNGKLKELSVDFEYVYPFSNGLALCKRMNTYTVYIDTTGWPVIEIPNENYTGDFFNEFATYSTVKNKYGFMNKKGHPISPCIYEGILNFSEGLAAVKIYNKWGFIDAKGKIIIPIKYDKVDQFNGGLAKIKIADKYGFIDKSGKIVIPLKLSESHNFNQGVALACDEKNMWGVISKNGQWVIKPQFVTMDNISETAYTTVIYSEKSQSKKGKAGGDKKALISKRGKIVWCSGSPLIIK